MILEGKRAKDPDGQPANHGIEGASVNNLRVINLWVRNYLANGVFIHDCHGYLMEDLRASFNRALRPLRLQLHRRPDDRLGRLRPRRLRLLRRRDAVRRRSRSGRSSTTSTAYENVLGYSGTNSKYVKITKSDFYNNGVGIVPNTLDSERFEPAATGIIQNNNIFWNNFNYFLPNSRVQDRLRRAREVGDLTINFPTGVGVVLLGADGWIVRENKIFGNFKWRGVRRSPTRSTRATTRSRATTSSSTTRWAATAPTRTRSTSSTTAPGSGNCFAGNSSSTFDPSTTASDASLYPPCPAPAPPASGTGTSAGDPDQFGELAGYVTTAPPENQECSWTKHAAPAVREVQAARRHAGADVSVRRRALTACALAAAAVSAVAVPASSGAPEAKRAKTEGHGRRRLLRPDRRAGRQGVEGQVGLVGRRTPNTHDVVLTNVHPKGVKKSDFRSSSGAVGIKFKRKFEVPGKYEFICTFHRGEMTADAEGKEALSTP